MNVIGFYGVDFKAILGTSKNVGFVYARPREICMCPLFLPVWRYFVRITVLARILNIS